MISGIQKVSIAMNSINKEKRGEESPEETNARLKFLARKQPIYEVAQQEIKAFILRNNLKPGDSLPPEAELARQLGISRNSLREAVKALESLGVLDARAGVGLFVRGFSFDPLLENLAYGLRIGSKDLRDIFEIRYHLEYSMAERAIQSVTPEQIAHLRAILERMHSAAQAGRYSAEDDRAFHQALWENVDNTILSKLLDIFWLIREQAQQSDLVIVPPDPLATYQRHVKIVDALAEHSTEALRAAITYERLLKHTADSASAPLEASKPPLARNDQ
jgi:DNA-binding FadR family transcriptional regulator